MNRPWHKHYHSDFRIGTRSLSLEERGAYITMLDLMYDQWSAIEDNDHDLAHECKVSIRKWKSIRERLIAKGKLIARGGYLINPRAEKVMAEAVADHEMRVATGSAGGLRRAENAGQIPTPRASCTVQTDAAKDETKLATTQGSSETEMKASREQLENEPKPTRKLAEIPEKPNEINGPGQAPLKLSDIDIEIEVESKTESPSDSLPHQPASQPDGHSGPAEGFDSWWEAYPRKVGKIAARAAYLKARKSGATDAELLAAVTAQQWSPEVQFQPHPAKWLSQGRWNDDPAAAAPRPPQASLPLLRSVTGDFKPKAAAQRPPLPALGDPPEAWFWLSEERGTRDGVTHAVVGAGSCLDLLCQSVCEAAGFRDASWRGDWQTVIAWVRDGIHRDQILSGVAEQAAWIRQRGGEPPRTLKNFDSAVRRTGRAA